MKIWITLSIIGVTLFAVRGGELRSQALAGKTHSQLVLGMEFLQGVNRSRNPELAVYWFRKAAQGGSALAQYNYAVCLERGVGVKQSRLSAYQEFGEAEKKGVKEATFRRAMLLYRGVAPESTEEYIRPGITADPVGAVATLTTLADEGLASAQRALAEMELKKSTEEQSSENLAKAIGYLEAAASKGDAPALRLLADCYYGGIGVTPNNEKMVYYLEKAVKAGDLEAYGKLAFCYENGIGVDFDDKRAFELLEVAAKAGLPMAIAKLGEYYMVGTFVEQSVPKAIEMYEYAVKRGNSYAMVRLAQCYSEGIGFAKDAEKAATLFLEAARLGDAGAQYNVGVAYRNGVGFPKDSGAAVYWFRQSAAQNNLEAMRELALCLIEGEGIDRDEASGMKLLQNAALAGDTLAKKLLEGKF